MGSGCRFLTVFEGKKAIRAGRRKGRIPTGRERRRGGIRAEIPDCAGSGIPDAGGVPEAPVLFIESSTAHASLALVRGDVTVAEEGFASDRNHNALLFAPLARLLDRLAPEERLAAVVIGTGPGSYSGTRVGIAAGQGVAMVHGCPAAGLCSLGAVPSAGVGVAALAIGDARRGSGWYARLEGGNDALPEPQLCEAAELTGWVERALAEGRPVFSVESVARLGLPATLAAAVRLETPAAGRLAQVWRALTGEVRERLLSEPVQPVYLRPPHITEAKPGHPLVRPK